MEYTIYKGTSFQKANALLQERFLTLSMDLLSALIEKPLFFFSKETYNSLRITAATGDNKIFFVITNKKGCEFRAYIDTIEQKESIEQAIEEYRQDNPVLPLLP